MKISVAYRLKRLASFIIKDETPTNEQILQRRGHRVDQTDDPKYKYIPVADVSVKKIETPDVKSDTPVQVSKVKVQREGPSIKIQPKIKPSRALPEHQKVWNTDNKKEKMKEYMKEYRSEGKVYETNGPKNFYVKQPTLQ